MSDPFKIHEEEEKENEKILSFVRKDEALKFDILTIRKMVKQKFEYKNKYTFMKELRDYLLDSLQNNKTKLKLIEPDDYENAYDNVIELLLRKLKKKTKNKKRNIKYTWEDNYFPEYVNNGLIKGKS